MFLEREGLASGGARGLRAGDSGTLDAGSSEFPRFRHILFLYPLLAILAAFACREIWHYGRAGRAWYPWRWALFWWGKGFRRLGFIPNYLSYTSLFAGSRPDERLLLDADFDGGQYIFKLKQVLAEHKVDHLRLRLFTSADLTQMNLPPFEVLAPYEHATGWIAVQRLQPASWRRSVASGKFGRLCLVECLQAGCVGG